MDSAQFKPTLFKGQLYLVYAGNLLCFVNLLNPAKIAVNRSCSNT